MSDLYGGNIEAVFDKIDDFFLDKPDPSDNIYKRRFFKEHEVNDKANYLKFLKFIDSGGECVYGIIRFTYGYLFFWDL